LRPSRFIGCLGVVVIALVLPKIVESLRPALQT
jgi:hypothetical protein